MVFANTWRLNMRTFFLYIASCIFFVITGCQSEKTVVLEDTQKAEEIIIGGSESVLPVLKQLAEAFESENQGKKILFTAPGHTSAGIKAVVEGIISIAAVSRNLKPEEKQLGFDEYWFAHDALVFAVHPTVNIKGLSLKDIGPIYYGSISGWEKLGGPKHPITVLDRIEGSSPKVLLQEKSVLSKEKKVTQKAVVFERPNDMNIAIASTAYSIGYTSLSLLLKDNYNLNILELDGIKATPETIRNGAYPLVRPIGFVIKGAPAGLAKEFTDYIFSEKGHSVLTKQGYVPSQRQL
ncbi:MAG: phosphate ABC transporter substrate-binding protein [Nitrospiraceae bacterium]|nr:MAG: phosphate ABC transporter substrate-binding protein [Nitrospiraceae bacterium]